jgi:glycolate oxidase FAD binding subunit
LEAAVTPDPAEVLKALTEACPDVREGSGCFAGPGLGFAVSPASTDEVSAVLRVAAARDLTVTVRGDGSQPTLTIGQHGCDVCLDLSRMSGVLEHAAGDLVARVQAGARMGDVAAVLAKAGQEIALDVPADATVGGVVASGLAGPRRLRYGTPRDLIIGITIVRADGTVAKAGGKVVKNVAGYDLSKLFAGSAGTLGVITEATFRLHPLPAARVYVTTSYTDAAAAGAAVAAAANSPLTPSAVELSRAEPDGPIDVGVLVEGSADGVGARASGLADLLGSASPATSSTEAPGWWPGPPALAAGRETLVRVSFWVSALPLVLEAVTDAAAQASLPVAASGSAGAGVLYLQPGAGADAAAVTAFVTRLRSAVGGPRGGVTVLAAPAAVRDALSADGGLAGPVPGAALMRAVKDQFDPDGRLSPDRFAETV